MADDARNYRGGCYWIDPAAGGQLSTATWRLDNPLLGRYHISVWYGGIPDGGVASDAPYTVKTRQGKYNFKVDQTQNTGRWNELGRSKTRSITSPMRHTVVIFIGFTCLCGAARGQIVSGTIVGTVTDAVRGEERDAARIPFLHAPAAWRRMAYLKNPASAP